MLTECSGCKHTTTYVTFLRHFFCPLNVASDFHITGPDARQEIDVSLYLDRVPLNELGLFIHDVQSSLTVGSKAMIGFTARGRHFPPSPSESSPLYALAAIPFLPRQHLRLTEKASLLEERPTPPRTTLRTLLPLRTTLDNVIYLLTSGKSSLTLKSVANISEEYAIHLDEQAERLMASEATRTKFQETWGMEGWREERLVATWEAALVRANRESGAYTEFGRVATYSLKLRENRARC